MFSLLPTLQNEVKPPVTAYEPEELPSDRKTLNNKPVNSVLQNETKPDVEVPLPPQEICTAAPKSTNHNHSNSNGDEQVEQDPMETKGLEELIKFINGTEDNSVGGKQHSAKAAKRARQKQRKVKRWILVLRSWD